MANDAAMRHVRRHDDVSCDADVSPPEPGRDDRAAGDSAAPSVRPPLNGQSARRTAQDVSRTDVDVAS